MPLSPSAENELRAELDFIESMRKKLDARAQVIRAVLEPFDLGQTRASGDVTIALTGVSAVASAGTVTASKFASNGLRAAILEVLRKRGPARAPNVAAILAGSGFKNESKTGLATRVYNDLWRMKEAGIVENRDGVFSLKEVA